MMEKIRNRLAFLFLTLSLFILVDEFVKEGYVFDPNDLINPSLTHEKIFLCFLVIGLLLGLRRGANKVRQR